MKCENIQSIIRGFVQKNIGTRELSDNDDIFKLGYVNSLFALRLVTFIEKTFDLCVEDEDLEMTNFNSVEAMGSFVLKKREFSPKL